MDQLGVEVLDKLDVAVAWLGVGIGIVLFENLLHWPLLDLANACHNTTRSVAALVTVNPHGMIGGVYCVQDGLAKSVEVGLDLALLVRLDIEDLAIDAVGGHVVVIRGARLCLCDQRTKRQSEWSTM